ncbi:MAG: hypothetical protein KF696_16295, partial [Planctomycetes bacterium]|nr:hypothetical protein [Planctomycetota bacterium]MCW8137223.1 hypothetical protein [Planctomycetota bacterium]
MQAKVRLFTAVAALVFCFTMLGGSLRAQQVLWYSGDFDFVDGLINGYNFSGIVADARVYCDFQVPTGETWTVTQVYCNSLCNLTTVNSLDYEVRQGMSAGNFGTLLHSGTINATWSYVSAGAYSYSEYRVDGTLTTSFVLSPGTYWINVRPRSTSATGPCYICTTSGTNGVGALNNSNSLMYAVGYNTAPEAWGYDFVCGMRGNKGPQLTVGGITTGTTRQNVYANDTGTGGN